MKILMAIVTDILTLGGAVNDGYFHNGNRIYTRKALEEGRKLKKYEKPTFIYKSFSEIRKEMKEQRKEGE